MTATDTGRLRQIMYQPSDCWLSTEYSGDRWLTDKYVLLNVTEEYVFADLPDGPYKLTASNGPQPRDAIPEPDIQAYFELIADSTWFPAQPTEWSVAEHPGKAQLWVSARRPVLLGESTWTQIKRHYPGIAVDYSGTRNMFRFRLEVPFCYAAGIKIPTGQEVMAQALADSLTQLATMP